MENIPFEKRLLSTEAKKMFWGHPNSPNVKTLPAGKPSPPVSSWIPQNGGYYQLGPVDGTYLYLKDTPDLKIVPKDAPDQSSWFSSLWNLWGDGVENVVNDVESYAGYTSEGFDKATKDLGKDIAGFGSDFRNILLAGVGLLVLVVVLIITSKFT